MTGFELVQPTRSLSAGIALPIRKKVKAQTVCTTQLTAIQMDRMYSLFSKYYDNHDKLKFMADLFDKTHVVLLKDATDGSIQGFSTLLKVNIRKKGINAIGIYSGDTVLEKEYWGSTALGNAFLKYIWLEKAKNPLRPVYWFLISKGYKTYLLMANNFKTYYPRHDQQTPEKYKNVMDVFYQSRFKENYNPKSGIIEMESSSCRLKEKIAELTPELTKNVKINFFAQKNPNWHKGFELTCLAQMTLTLPLEYLVRKSLQKRFKK